MDSKQIRISACFAVGPSADAVKVDGEPGYLLGRHYTVYPVVMLREGVHRGTSGVADYFGASEIEQSARTWAGKPVTIGHPDNSCDDPSVIEDAWIGSIFDAWYDDDAKALKGKAWIDNERGDHVIGALRAGKKIDVSVGVWGNFSAEQGSWNDKAYEAKAESLVADHLAILPDTEGACSWDDGCGIREYQESLFGFVRSSARTPTYKGTETTSWANVPKTIGAFVDAYYAERGGRPEDGSKRVQDLPSAVKRWIAAKTLLGDEGADTERDLLFFPVVNPRTGKLNAGALRAVLGGRGTQADIPAAALKSAQAKARVLLEKEFGRDRERREESKEMKQAKVARNMQLESDVGMMADCLERAGTVEEIDDCLKMEELPEATVASDLDSLLAAASPQLKKELQESHALAQSLREETTKRILDGPVEFCPDWLQKQSLQTLQRLDDLVKRAGEDKQVVLDEPNGMKATSYALQLAAGRSVTDKYIAPPVIAWSAS